MNKTPELINLQDWSEFGGSFSASSYYHNTDNNIMMKLYANFMPPEEALRELECSEKILALGLRIAKPIKYVNAEDGRYGGIFERFQNKRSFARIISEEPNRLEEMAKLFASEAKKLHSLPCDTRSFVSVEDKYRGVVSRADFFTETLKKNIEKVLAETPKTTTCLHGDFHIGNILMVDSMPHFIDLGDFCYGNPLYDIGVFNFQWKCSNDEMCNRLYHMNVDTMHKVWDCFVENYFESTDNIEEIVKPYTMLTAVNYACKIGSFNDFLTAAVKDYL